MIITEEDIEKLLKDKRLTIKDTKDYSFYIHIEAKVIIISYGLFSNPLEYKRMYFNGARNNVLISLDYVNDLALKSKKHFIDEVDTPHMRGHYQA